MEVRERFERLDLEDGARHAKHIEQFLEKWRRIDIEPKNRMAKLFQDK